MVIRNILEEPIPKESTTYDRQTLGKVKELYKQCLDENTLNDIDIKPLVDVVRVVQGLYNGSTSIESESRDPSKQSFSKSSKKHDLTAALAYMHSRGKTPYALTEYTSA
jgi:hypothetical protein